MNKTLIKDLFMGATIALTIISIPMMAPAQESQQLQTISDGASEYCEFLAEFSIRVSDDFFHGITMDQVAYGIAQEPSIPNGVKEDLANVALGIWMVPHPPTDESQLEDFKALVWTSTYDTCVGLTGTPA